MALVIILEAATVPVPVGRLLARRGHISRIDHRGAGFTEACMCSQPLSYGLATLPPMARMRIPVDVVLQIAGLILIVPVGTLSHHLVLQARLRAEAEVSFLCNLAL